MVIQLTIRTPRMPAGHRRRVVVVRGCAIADLSRFFNDLLAICGPVTRSNFGLARDSVFYCFSNQNDGFIVRMPSLVVVAVEERASQLLLLLITNSTHVGQRQTGRS